MDVLIIGYGSIGKQHVESVLKQSKSNNVFVLTKHADSNERVTFISDISQAKSCTHAIICTPTDKHLSSFLEVVSSTEVKNVLIEKPITLSKNEALEVANVANRHKIDVHVAYCMRQDSNLKYVKQNIQLILDEIKLVKIYCGQYLPEWRAEDYRKSYSSDAKRGGGVHLDLSHEIDYMNWLFGKPFKVDFSNSYKISSLEINSIDYFKAIYNYKNFIVDLELDYFRKLDRKLIILGENKVLVELDFVKNKLFFQGKEINLSPIEDLFHQDCLFLSGETEKLCSQEDAIEVMDLIN